MKAADGERPPKASRPSRIPLYLAFGLIGLLLGAYYFYVRWQAGSFERRNLRILGGLTLQINGAFEAQEMALRNWANAQDDPDADRARLLSAFDPAPCALRAVAGDEKQRSEVLNAVPGRQVTVRRLQSQDGQLWLQVAWDGFVRRRTSPLVLRPAAFVPPEEEESLGTPVCRQIALSTLLGSVMNRERFGVFDNVFLAETGGRVLYGARPLHSASTLLWLAAVPDQPLTPGRIETNDLTLSDLGAMEEREGWRQTKALALKKLDRAARRTDVEVAGRDFVLFTQPYLFSRPNAAPGNGQSTWLVGGIVSRARFTAETRAVSASKAAFAIALCLLALCAWPFLQIALKEAQQPLTMADVVLVIVGAMAGIMILTLSILDWLAYRRFTDSADGQLRQFAYKLDRDFHRNVNDAWRALDAMEGWAADRTWAATTEADLIRSADLPESIYRAKGERGDAQPVAEYPYFIAFTLIDGQGMQRYKATARARQPLVDVSGRDYFQKALARETWDAAPPVSGGERRPYTLEWVRSLATGEIQALIAKPVRREALLNRLPVAALTVELIDVRHAVTPPGTAFAIIDEQGTVVYHSDEQRIRREDFFLETDQHRELRAAVLGRTDSFVTTRYSGEDQRMFVHPLRNTPWTLITMRDKRLVRAINIEALLLTMLGLGFNALPYLLIFGVILVMKPWYRAPYLWPVPERDRTYARVVAVLAVGAATLALSIYSVRPSSLLPIVALLPAQVMLSVYVRLNRQPRASRIALAAWSAVTVLLFAVFASVDIDADLFVSRYPARVRLLLVLTLGFSTLVAWTLMRAERREEGEALSWLNVRWRRALDQCGRVVRTGLTATPLARMLAVTAGTAASYFLPARAILARPSWMWVGLAALAQWIVAIAWVALPPARRAGDLPTAAHTARFRSLRAAWWIATMLLAVAIALGQVRARESEWGLAGVAIAFGAASLVTLYLADRVLDLFTGVFEKWFATCREAEVPIAYPASYKLAITVALILAAVLPTIGYFKIGSRIEQEALIKYAQLRLATALEDRVNRIAAMVTYEDGGVKHALPFAAPVRDAFGYRLSNVWDSLWTLNDTPPARDDASPRAPLIAQEMLADYVPQYSEDSVAMRQLYAGGSADALWSWTRSGRLLTLDRMVRFKPAVAALLAPGQPLRRQTLTISSYVPLLFASWVSMPNTRSYVATPLTIRRDTGAASGLFELDDVGYTLFIVLLAIGGCALLWWIARFFAERVLLMDVHTPDWAKIVRGAPLATNVFLTRGRAAIEFSLRALGAGRFHELRFADLERKGEWESSHQAIDAAPGRTVRVWDHEYGIDDPAMQTRKLAWLERVLARGDRPVMIVSSRSQQYSTDEAWKKLFARFLCLDWEDVELRARLHQQRRRGTLGMVRLPQEVDARQRENASWLEEETEWSSALVRYRDGLRLSAERSALIDELGERAAPYFDRLWGECSLEEKVLLFHLARYGFVQGRNHETLRRLFARGLVRRDPNLELLSETFRLYVLRVGQRDEIQAVVRQGEEENVLRAWKTPIFTVILALLMLLFATQKDLMTSATGLATALTTSLPIIAKLLGIFADQRGESGARV